MKVKSILFVYAYMLLIFFGLGCNQNSGKNQNGAKDDTTDNRLSIGEHFAPVNGITLHYYVAGSGPVCLAPSPGWGDPVGYLYESLKPFEKYFTMVFYDTRNSGKSTGPDDPTKYTDKDFMNDMDSLRVYLGQSKVWLLGHSDGGYQVLYFGVHHNENLNGIIALDPMAGADSFYLAEFTKNLRARRAIAPKVVDMFLGKDTTHYTIGEIMKMGMPLYFHDTSKVKLMSHTIDTTLSQKAWDYTGVSGFGRKILLPELHKISVPVLVVVGDDDSFCPKASQADRIAKNISNSTEIVIKDAGHLCWIEQPEQFFSECEKWLEGQKLGG